jgi:hypothetical protein
MEENELKVLLPSIRPDPYGYVLKIIGKFDKTRHFKSKETDNVR